MGDGHRSDKEKIIRLLHNAIIVLRYNFYCAILVMFFQRDIIWDMGGRMKSNHYKAWYSKRDFRRCRFCKEMHGKIYEIMERPVPSAPAHKRCRCVIERIDVILAGMATKNGINGADWWLKKWRQLPDYYIGKDEAERLGWKSYLGNLHQKAPGRMLAKGVYHNADGHLPSAPNRVWYEADINYSGGVVVYLGCCTPAMD